MHSRPKAGIIPNCRFHFGAVIGEDTAHGGLPWPVSPPARGDWKYIRNKSYQVFKRRLFLH